jgi:hypothetical protein
LGSNWDVTVVAGNRICVVKTQIRGEEGRNRMCGIVVTTNGNGNLVKYRTTAAIRLREMRGWLQLYKYNGNLLQNHLMVRSKIPQAAQIIAGRKVLFASRNDKSAGGK